MQDDRGRIFREAWIAGIAKHFPGTPKDSYITPWDQTPEWEKACATAVYDYVADFIEAGDDMAKLSRVQKGQFVAVCWREQVRKHVAEPKPSHIPAWDDMPEWWRQIDCDIFETIERHINR
ncbi:hypothetical protein [Lentzea sp. CC55]|uniref:hypothetical protein n=1 Tax=Lentzea sp. CC55 TaxID=2884909 RepID=UPI0027DFFD88|nr:hypothetical protein [Lentzea sp. CC55]MCG8924998.1 hypothetical protein [Lentzea sp. CC55]